MRVLLSTNGSRGDVQPLVALAVQLRELGHEAHLCVPPDFRDWIDGIGIGFTGLGPELRKATAASSSAPAGDRLRRLAQDSVATQFETLGAAAKDCDVVVGATALMVGARSVAELTGVPYVFVSYCPAVLPSPHHEPLPMGGPPPATAGTRERWEQDAARFEATFRDVLNAHRDAAGLAPVGGVRDHVVAERPWLAADPTLGPWPGGRDEHTDGYPDLAVFQPGAWILPDERPLAAELEAFLDAGEPPVYFGFGSIRAPGDLSTTMIGTARALGRRAIVSRGWADLSLLDGEPDCLAIGEVNQQALFGRVAVAVHHGGAGTTTAAALAGAPQVLVPQLYDQHYWARRVDELGVGSAHAPGAPTTDSLTSALERALTPQVAAGARSVATAVRRDGARSAAERLLTAL